MEVWKDIKNYEGIYQVSDLGNIKRVNKQRQLIPCPNSRGYKLVQLSKNGKMRSFTVHGLVASHFLIKPIIENEYININHIDGNKLNNTASNLEWITHKENMRHAFRTGLITKNGPNGRRPIDLNNDRSIAIRAQKGKMQKWRVGLLFRCAYTTVTKIWEYESPEKNSAVHQLSTGI